MARRRFRSNQRNDPASERSFQEYMLSVPALQTSRTELMRLVRGGEDTYLELKVKLSNPERIAQGICALANTGGGVIVFGVNDQLRVEGVDNPEDVRDELVRICRENIIPPVTPFIDAVAFDNGRRIVALDVVGKRRPYRTADGRFFIRIGAEKREATRQELSVLLDEARPLFYENVPVLGATGVDIDEAQLYSFVRAFAGDAYNAQSAHNYETEELLKKDLLLATGNAGEIIPTVAGLLLFGRDESVGDLLPRAGITIKRYAGENLNSEEIESAKFVGNLYGLYEFVMRFIARYCDLWDARPKKLDVGDYANAPVVPRANYPRGAVREAVINLLAHRELFLREPATRINIFERAIEFANPRRTNGLMPAAARAIRYGIPQRTNTQTQAILVNPAYGLEVKERGLPQLLRQARLFAGRRAEIQATNDEFKLKIYGV